VGRRGIAINTLVFVNLEYSVKIHMGRHLSTEATIKLNQIYLHIIHRNKCREIVNIGMCIVGCEGMCGGMGYPTSQSPRL
jgi:hypothetical protein